MQGRLGEGVGGTAEAGDFGLQFVFFGSSVLSSAWRRAAVSAAACCSALSALNTVGRE